MNRLKKLTYIQYIICGLLVIFILGILLSGHAKNVSFETAQQNIVSCEGINTPVSYTHLDVYKRQEYHCPHQSAGNYPAIGGNQHNRGFSSGSCTGRKQRYRETDGTGPVSYTHLPINVAVLTAIIPGVH